MTSQENFFTPIRPQRVVIVGAGFAGVHAYKEFHKRAHGTGRFEITLINPTDRFTFIPMLHEVATGVLPPEAVVQPIRTLPQCCLNEFIEGEAREIDCDRKVVKVLRNDLTRTQDDNVVPASRLTELQYDYLVLAAGAKTAYFGVVGAEEHALAFKTLGDARAIKNRVIESFEQASRAEELERQKALLRLVIVGGGATGVELAGELAEMIEGAVSASFPHLRGLAQIIVIERGTHLIAETAEWCHGCVERAWEKSPLLYVMYETSVTKVTAEGVETSRGFVPAGTVVWSAGVVANEILFMGENTPKRDERTGRLIVNKFLQLPECPEIFVAGDQALAHDAAANRPYPMRAQFAVREGAAAARNIMRLASGEAPEPFAWKERGFIIAVGKGRAFAEIFGIRFSGPVAWLIYYFAYLGAIVGTRAKLRTALEWGMNLLASRDISKI